MDIVDDSFLLVLLFFWNLLNCFIDCKFLLECFIEENFLGINFLERNFFKCFCFLKFFLVDNEVVFFSRLFLCGFELCVLYMVFFVILVLFVFFVYKFIVFFMGEESVLILGI